MRAQSYGETLAFVQLLNALLAAAGSRLPDHGVPYRHYTHFVRVHVFGHITQRAYRSAAAAHLQAASRHAS